MRIRGWGAALGAAVILAASTAWSGEAAALAAQAEQLELREELLAAQLVYLDAAKAAASEASAAAGDRRAYLWAQADFCLEKAHAFLADTGETDDLLQLTRQLSAAAPPASGAAATPPPAWLRRRAAWIGASALERSGRDAEPDAVFPGAAREWLVTGLFDFERAGGLDAPAGPENGPPDPTARYPGAGTPVGWTPLPCRDPLGRMDLANRFTPRPGVAAYALAWFHSDAEAAGQLHLGADGWAAAWVNGFRLGGGEAETPLDPDQRIYPVLWRAGWNTVLLKLAPGRDGWRFMALAEGASNGTWSAKRPPAMSMADFSAAPPPRPLPAADHGALTAFADQVRRDPDDHRAFYQLGSLIVLRGHRGGGRFDGEAFLGTAIGLAPREAMYRIAYARAAESSAEGPSTGPDREENLYRRWLESAMEFPEAKAAATVALGRYALDLCGQRERAGVFADEATAANPLALRARLLQTDVELAHGWNAAAETRLRETIRRHPGSAGARLRLARLERERGRWAAALAEYRAAHQLDALSLEAFRGTVAMLGRIEQMAEARNFVAASAARLSRTGAGRSAWFAALADVGDWSGLRQAAETFLREGNPSDPKALAALARGLEELGEGSAAVTTWRQAVAADPADVPARERLRTLIREGGGERSPASAFAPPEPGFPEGPGDSPEAFRAWAAAQPFSPPTGSDWAYLYYDVDERVDASGSRSVRVRAVARAATLAGAAELGRQWIRFGDDDGGRVLRARVLRGDGTVDDGDGGSAPPGRSGADGGREAAFLPAMAPGDTAEWILAFDRRLPDFLNGEYAQVFHLARDAWSRQTRYALTLPSARPVQAAGVAGAPDPVRHDDPTAQTSTFVWIAAPMPAATRERWTAPLLEIEPSAVATTFLDWDALARWYWGLVEPQWHSTPEIKNLALGFLNEQKTRERALTAAHQWVTRNIRHEPWPFDLYAFRPFSPRTILSRRYGDGKDRSLVFGLLARELGYDAMPTLAWTAGVDGRHDGPRSPDSYRLPVPHVFNHAGVRIAADGQTYLFDANQPYAWALDMPFGLSGGLAMVAGPAADWMRLPELGSQGSVWEEEASLTLSDDGGAEWAQNVGGGGLSATYLRAWFGSAERRSDAWTRLAEGFGGTPTTAAADLFPYISEGRAAFSGRTTLAGFAIPGGDDTLRAPVPPPFLAGTFGSGASLPERLSDWTVGSRRTTDLLLPAGFKIHRKIRVDWPEGWTLARLPAPLSTTTPFGRLSSSWQETHNGVMIELLVEVSLPRIPAGLYPAFRRFCAAADAASDLSLSLRRAAPEFAARGDSGTSR